MRVITNISEMPKTSKGAVLTMGNFDGVHLAHRKLFRLVREKAAAKSAMSIACTFEPHPYQVLLPDRSPNLINSYEEKLQMIEEQGIETVLVLKFDKAFAAISAEDFIHSIIIKGIQPSCVYVGENFRFGYKRQGDVRMLAEFGQKYGFEVHGILSITRDGRVVSSTLIRYYIREGRMDLARELLTRPFHLASEVVEGDRRGQTIGFPTTNQVFKDRVLPLNGVYTTLVELPDGRRLPGATYVGPRPTFKGKQTVVETNILDFEGDLYGQWICVYFLKYIRGEAAFPNVDALVTQISEDVERIREYFGEEGQNLF